MEKSEETFVCASCGARLDRDMVYCPYCGATNPAAAEKKYMDSLQNVRRDLDGLKSVPKDEIVAEAKEAGRLIRKAVILILAVTVIAAGSAVYQTYRDKQEDEKEYIWMRDNIPMLDSYFENRKYDELLKFYKTSADEDVPVWRWNHYRVLYYLELADQLDKELAEEKDGTSMDSDARTWVLLGELELLHASRYSDLPKDDAAWISEFAKPYLRDLEERFSLSEEEIEHFMKMAEDGYGSLRFEQCDTFLKTRGQE